MQPVTEVCIQVAFSCRGTSERYQPDLRIATSGGTSCPIRTGLSETAKRQQLLHEIKPVLAPHAGQEPSQQCAREEGEQGGGRGDGLYEVLIALPADRELQHPKLAELFEELVE